MTAIAVYGPSGSSGELQFANSSGRLDAAQAFWDSTAGKLFISGNLEVLGTETVVDTQHLNVEDGIIGLGTGSAGEGAAGDRGFIFLVSGETNPSFYWDDSADEFRAARVTTTPGNTTFEDPTGVGAGGYQNLKIKTLNAVSGAILDSDQRSLATIGTDVFAYISGSDVKRAVFGGDVVVSGTLYGGSPLKLGGEVEFVTSDGETTDLKNPSGSVKMFARDEVKIGSDDGLIRFIDLGGSTAGKIFVTGSSTTVNRRFKFLSKGQIQFHGSNPNAVSPGTDVFVFVSGAIGSTSLSLSRGATLFGGDIVASGSAKVYDGISGSITHLYDGSSYLMSDTDITITTGSNGSVSVKSNAQDQRKKFVYEITGAHSSESGLIIPSLDLSSVSHDPNRIDVFVNGQLMSSGSTRDYTVPQNNSVLFYFNLIPDDIVTIRTY